MTATKTRSRLKRSAPAESKRVSPKRQIVNRRVGGVAPFVRPPSRYARWRKLSGWRRRGFVPLSPEREKRRHRVLPRTVIGISTMLMSAGIGAGFAGAAFYAYYDNRLAENELQVAGFVSTFDAQFEDAAGSLDTLRAESIDQIRTELVPLEEYVSDANGVVGLPETAGPSVWAIETTDDDGRAVVGAAFAVAGHEGGTALVTSYTVVRSATVTPAPPIRLIKDGVEVSATLWSWDPERDLALVVTDQVIPVLPLADDGMVQAAIGQRVFAMSGIGGRGATASPGVLLDQSAEGLQHTARQGPVFAGGPLVTGDGNVIGMTSTSFSPNGLDFGDVVMAPDAAAFCFRILSCADVRGQPTVAPAEG